MVQFREYRQTARDMSTVLLMSDTWQPTVLQLAPFSSNNARPVDKRPARRPPPGRGFPVLAVTRSATSGPSSAATTPRCTSGRSLTSLHSIDLNSLKSADFSETYTKSDCSGFAAHFYPPMVTKSADSTNERVYSPRKANDYRKYAKKIFPEAHSEYKEAMAFSVQDLNDQTSSASSFKSAESETTVPRTSVLDNTRTKLPKPSMCPSPDGKLYSPSHGNGVRRFVPLTPGELDLKRYRDKSVKEQAQKKKKYKLNINELPRSNTPINENDPDKLNMKQVIAFLQTKASRDANQNALDEKREIYDKLTKSKYPPKSAEVKSNLQKSNAKQPRVKSENKIRTTADDRTVERVGADGGSAADRTVERVGADGGSAADMTVERVGADGGSISVLSIQTTPNMTYGVRSVKSQSSHHSESSNNTRRAVKHRPVREFKLHRFLAFASEPETQDLNPSIDDKKLLVETPADIFSSNKATISQSPRRYLRRKPRTTTTANLLHRRAAAQKPTQSTDNDNDADNEQCSPIRLPSMTDNQPADDNDESDTDSVSTSVTFNSTKISSSKDDRLNYPKKGITLPVAAEKPQKHVENKRIVDDDRLQGDLTVNEGFPSFMARMHKTPEFPKVNINGLNKNRHIHVDVPNENKNGYSQEIVRLTLRQEKNATRVTTYMSDMMNGKVSQEETDSDIREGDTILPQRHSLLMNNYVSYHDNQTWYEAPRQLINSISNKTNFVKVRQKQEPEEYNNE